MSGGFLDEVELQAESDNFSDTFSCQKIILHVFAVTTILIEIL